METGDSGARIPARHLLRAHGTTWIVTGLLPLPILVAADPQANAELACGYLGLASAWLASEIYGDAMRTRSHRRAAIGAILIAIGINAACLIACGVALNVRTNLPFPLLAILSTVPALGMIPWLIRRLQTPPPALFAATLIVLGAKLTGCVVARLRYGPNYVELGYVSDNWHLAKLMISIFWGLTIAVSTLLLLLELASSDRERVPFTTVVATPGQGDFPEHQH
jgi:hypothetical protein